LNLTDPNIQRYRLSTDTRAGTIFKMAPRKGKVTESRSHALDFVKEVDGDNMFSIKQHVVQLTLEPRSCAFLFGSDILLNAGGRLPKRLGDLLQLLKNCGYKMFAIRPPNTPNVASTFPQGRHPFDGIYTQEESQDSNECFLRCYDKMQPLNVVFFGSEDVVLYVLDHRKEKDAFVSVGVNPDTRDGSPSYLEEMLMMVLAVQHGKEITSYLQISTNSLI
jgi:hypothetical protein